MFKKLLVGGLALIVAIAIGASAYNAYANQSTETNSNTLAVKPEYPVAEKNGGPGREQGAGQGWQQENTPFLTDETADTPAPDRSTSQNFSPHAPEAAALSNGQGNRNGQGRGRGQSGGSEAGLAGGQQVLQNNYREWITLEGSVSNYLPPEFTLTTSDGQVTAAQLGNMGYVETLGLSLQDGELVTVTGSYDADGGFAVREITLQSSGQTYALRDASGRPAWAGGRKGG